MRNDEFLGKAALAVDDESFKKLGIKKDETEIWEDGLRTSGKENSMEWWYCDAEFEDGTSIVVMFFTKNGINVKSPAMPMATFEITHPDGSKMMRKISEEEGTVIRASKEVCDVNVLNSYIRYVDGDYEVFFQEGDLTYKASMKSLLPMWRPGTGHSFYGEEKKDYMAWFVAEPACEINATLKIGNQSKALKGKGYHDHNWSNVELSDVTNHWYWCRAVIGDYVIIASDKITHKKYGYSRINTIFLAKDNEIVADDQSKTIIERGDTYQHEVTNKFMDNHLTFIQPSDNGMEYKIEFFRESDISITNFLDSLPKDKRDLAKKAGANPTYIRIIGKVKLTITEEGKEPIIIEDEALWEQMHLGSNKAAIINEK